jgi:hypothetical protein
VAVLVDDPIVPAAVARTIDLVAAAPVDLVGIHVQSPIRRRSFAARLADIVDRGDRACFRPRPDAFRPVALDRIHGDRMSTGSDTALRADLGDLDVLLDLTTEGSAGPATVAARLGTWRLRHGDERLPLGRAIFARDFARGSDMAITELIADDGAPRAAPGARPPEARVIYRSVGSMDRRSPARTRNAAAWKSAEFPARVASTLAAGGRLAVVEPRPDQRLDRGSLTARDSIRVVRTVVARGVREAGRRLFSRPGWIVAIRAGRPRGSTDWPHDLQGFRPLETPAGRFYADPFVVQTVDGVQLFVEDAPVGGGPGRIATLALDRSGRALSGPRVVLERPTHLSYPFVFADAGDWYMLPETAGTRTVELFRARDFPGEWEPIAVLLRDIQAADPTLVRHDGRWWLFVAVATFGANPWDELSIYWSETLAGPWHPHRQNPVISDAGRARPAGRILVSGDSLVRPAQDCLGGYGRRIVLNRIDVLNADEYREVPIGAIEPRALAGVTRTHTYAVDDGIEALDALRYAPRWWSGRLSHGARRSRAGHESRSAER